MDTSRRSVIAALAGGVLRAAPKSTAYALIGDRYHNSDYIRTGLSRTISKALDVSIDFCDETRMLTAETLNGYKLLIILRDGMNWPDGYDKPHVKWMTEEQQQAIWDFVNRGGGFLALHNSQGLYPAGGLYYKLFGGDYGGHPKPYTFTIRIEDKNHPITAGVEDFEIFDEQHTVKYYLGREHLLLRSIAPDNLEAAAGWWREMGKGRFCYLAPGHTPDALGHPMVQRLIRNALRWLVRVD